MRKDKRGAQSFKKPPPKITAKIPRKGKAFVSPKNRMMIPPEQKGRR